MDENLNKPDISITNKAIGESQEDNMGSSSNSGRLSISGKVQKTDIFKSELLKAEVEVEKHEWGGGWGCKIVCMEKSMWDIALKLGLVGSPDNNSQNLVIPHTVGSNDTTQGSVSPSTPPGFSDRSAKTKKSMVCKSSDRTISLYSQRHQTFFKASKKLSAGGKGMPKAHKFLPLHKLNVSDLTDIAASCGVKNKFSPADIDKLRSFGVDLGKQTI